MLSRRHRPGQRDPPHSAGPGHVAAVLHPCRGLNTKGRVPSCGHNVQLHPVPPSTGPALVFIGEGGKTSSQRFCCDDCFVVVVLIIDFFHSVLLYLLLFMLVSTLGTLECFFVLLFVSAPAHCKTSQHSGCGYRNNSFIVWV